MSEKRGERGDGLRAGRRAGCEGGAQNNVATPEMQQAIYASVVICDWHVLWRCVWKSARASTRAAARAALSTALVLLLEMARLVRRCHACCVEKASMHETGVAALRAGRARSWKYK